MNIAVYGGAFNPVHLGHIEIAKQLNKNYNFDKILIIPSKFSPHKSNDTLASDEHRLNMCKIAFGELDNCEVSDIEIKRNKISFTIDTLTELKTIYPLDELHLVCGSDMFLSLLKWRKPEEIFNLASILAFVRDNESIDLMNEYQLKLEQHGAKSKICTVNISPFSSTQVRNAIANGEDFEHFLNKKVYDYIVKNNLFRD